MAVSRMACSTISSSLSSRSRGTGDLVQLFNSCLSFHSFSLHWHTTQTLVGAVSSLVISVPTGYPVVTANCWTQPCVPLIPHWLYWRLLRGWYLWRDRPPSNHAHLGTPVCLLADRMPMGDVIGGDLHGERSVESESVRYNDDKKRGRLKKDDWRC